jgi:hypothetical protein
VTSNTVTSDLQNADASVSIVLIKVINANLQESLFDLALICPINVKTLAKLC